MGARVGEDGVGLELRGSGLCGAGSLGKRVVGDEKPGKRIVGAVQASDADRGSFPTRGGEA